MAGAGKHLAEGGYPIAKLPQQDDQLGKITSPFHVHGFTPEVVVTP